MRKRTRRRRAWKYRSIIRWRIRSVAGWLWWWWFRKARKYALVYFIR